MAEPKKTQDKPQAKEPEYPDTPSGNALRDIGGRGPDLAMDGSNQDEVVKHAAAYEAAKKKYRWG